jgi:hypothetical protein
MHFILPDRLPDQLSWRYDLPTWLHVVLAALLGLVAWVRSR